MTDMAKANPVNMLESLSQGLFWDIKIELLNPENHAGYIIPRVMDHGRWEDVKTIWKYYGSERIRQHLLNAPSLQKITIHFFASHFELPLESFKAYRKLKDLKTWNR